MKRDYEAEALTAAWSNWIARRQAQIAASKGEQELAVPATGSPLVRPPARPPRRRLARRRRK